MAFSAAGVQTGTDTDLTGLTSITGVTSATDGNVVTYTVPATFNDSIEIRGTLSHNTELERIIFQRPLNAEGNPPMIWINGGTYNFGIEKSPGVFTDGVGIQLNGAGAIWYNGGFNGNENGAMITIGTSGTNPLVDVSTLNINGGRIAGQFHITVRPNGVLNNTYNGKFLVDDSTQAAGQEWLSRFYGGTFGATNFAYEGGSISLGNGSHGRTLTFDRVNAGVAYWAQHANGTTFAANDADTYPTVRNVTFSGNVVDVAAWQSTTTNVGAVRIQNCGNGSNININGGETTGNNANNAGYVWITRQIETNFRALADQSNVDATVRVFDTNRQTDLNLPITALATGGITYTGQTDGTLTSWTASGTGTGVTSINTDNDNEIVLAFWSLDRDGNDHVRGTIDTGDWAMDRRSEGGVIGVDDFIFYTYAYGFNPITTTADLAGTGTLTLSENFIADPNITETDEAVALAYTGIVTTNQSVVVSANRSLDQLYDKAMADKVNNNALSTDDTVVQDWLFSATTGDTLTLDGTKTISIGANVLAGGTTHQTLATNTTVTIDDTGFNGVTFNGATTGDFGAITNNSNITTSDTTAQTVQALGGSNFNTQAAVIVGTNVDGSTLTGNGNVSVTGNAEDSNITSTTGQVSIGGTSTENVINSSSHTTITGLATDTMITSGGRIQLDGGSSGTTGTSNGHFDVNAGTHTQLTATVTGVNSDIRSQGATVTLDRCVFTCDDQMLMQNNVVTGGTFTVGDVAGNLINISGTGSITDAEFVTPMLSEVAPGRLVSGNTFGDTGRTMTIQFASGNLTTNLNGLLGTGWTNGGAANSITLTNTGGTITINVSQADVNALAITNDAGDPLSAGETTTVENGIIFAFAGETYDITIDGTLAEIQGRGGFFAIWDETGTAAVLAPVNCATITSLDDVTVQKASNNMSNWRIYYKPATTWGAGRTAYGMSLNADGTILSLGQPTGPVSVGVNVHVAAITGGSLVQPAPGYGVYTLAGTGANSIFNIALDVDTDPDGYSGGETQASSLEAANSEHYFQAHYNKVRTREMFAPGANNASDWDVVTPAGTPTDLEIAQASGYRFTSGDGSTPPLQQVISQISGLVTQRPNGYPEVLGVTEGSATIATVQGAVAGAISTGITEAGAVTNTSLKQQLANGLNTGQVFEGGVPVAVDTAQ